MLTDPLIGALHTTQNSPTAAISALLKRVLNDTAPRLAPLKLAQLHAGTASAIGQRLLGGQRQLSSFSASGYSPVWIKIPPG